MQDRRQSSRKTVSHSVEIHDRDRACIVGILVNISPGGLLMMAKQPIEPRGILQLSLKLPGDTERDSPLEFGCETLWVEQQNQQYWGGLQIIDISDDALARLKDYCEASSPQHSITP